MELEDVCCLHLPLWQSVLTIVVVRSEQGGKSLLPLLEGLLLCAEECTCLKDGPCTSSWVGVSGSFAVTCGLS